MAIEKNLIPFAVFHGGKKYELKTYTYEYRNLMVLLYDQIYIEDFGECKGMGRCGTCAVRIEGIPEAVNNLDRNEDRTLSKLGLYGSNVRLSCQVLVNESLENVKVEIVDSEYGP